MLDKQVGFKPNKIFERDLCYAAASHKPLKIGVQQMLDSCLEPGKIDAIKMLDLQTKSTIDSDNSQVSLQATYL